MASQGRAHPGTGRELFWSEPVSRCWLAHGWEAFPVLLAWICPSPLPPVMNSIDLNLFRARSFLCCFFLFFFCCNFTALWWVRGALPICAGETIVSELPGGLCRAGSSQTLWFPSLWCWDADGCSGPRVASVQSGMLFQWCHTLPRIKGGMKRPDRPPPAEAFCWSCALSHSGPCSVRTGRKGLMPLVVGVRNLEWLVRSCF